MTSTEKILEAFDEKFPNLGATDLKKGWYDVKFEVKFFFISTIAQALAEERERMRGEIKERKIPEIIDLKYFEKDGIGKTLLLKMTHDTAYNYGLKHGYNQALCALLDKINKDI